MRKANLARLLARRVDGIFLADFEQGEIGPDLFRHACLMGLEGMVSKHRESTYRGGRSALDQGQEPAASGIRPRAGSVLSRIAQLDQRTALPDQCLHSAEADVRTERRTRISRCPPRRARSRLGACPFSHFGRPRREYNSPKRHSGYLLGGAVRGRVLTKTGDTERRLIAIFAADVEGYSRLMGADEVGTFKDLTQRRDILDSLIASRRGRIANTAGDSVLAEFGSAVDAVQCAVEAQAALSQANVGLSPDRHINFRIGVHVGDVMIKGGDLFGDGVNIAARLQTLASAGGVCLSGVAYDQVRKILPFAFADLGAQQVKNIDEPVRAFSVVAERAAVVTASENASVPLALPDKPSIAVLPFQNMSGDPEQEYFADGIVEDIITALSRFKSLFVIARNSSFTFKGRAVDIKEVGRRLGVRYVLEGSVRKASGKVRITGQLIDAVTGAHLWADRFERDLTDIFALQDEVTRRRCLGYSAKDASNRNCNGDAAATGEPHRL